MTELQQVAIGRTQAFTGYPACRFYLSGIQNELKDNLPSNWRTYQFTIEIYQELSNKTVAAAEADFQDAIDAVLDKLNSQWTLGNNVDVSVLDGGTVAQAIAARLTYLASCGLIIAATHPCRRA